MDIKGGGQPPSARPRWRRRIPQRAEEDYRLQGLADAAAGRGDLGPPRDPVPCSTARDSEVSTTVLPRPSSRSEVGT